jgi:haloalkane dehalogenase
MQLPIHLGNDYPFASKFLDLEGLRYHYLDEGHGRPVLMLHGNPTWSYYYRRLVLALCDRWRVIVPDHIGCGLSDKPADNHYRYTLEQRARDVETLLEHLNITGDLTLVLHDWGGIIGMLYAYWHPERIRRLVLFNTAAFHLPAGKAFPWPLWLFRNTPLGPWLVRGLNLFCLGASQACSTRRLPAAVRRRYLAPYGTWADRIAILRFVQDIPLAPGDRAYALVSEVQSGLHRFREIPTLICWGARDFVFDDHFLRAWGVYLPHAEVHRFDLAGHYVLEDAAEEILPLVRDFLGRTEGSEWRGTRK